MDFTLSDEQKAIDELAQAILADVCAPDVLRAVETQSDRTWPQEVWPVLADAGLLGFGIPEEFGGAGYGLLELGVVIQAVAQAAAPLPAFASLVLGALPIAEFGSSDQQKRWLRGIANGTQLVTGILCGADDNNTVLTREVRADQRRSITGEGWYVPFGAQADAFVVPVETVSGQNVLTVIAADAPGITIELLSPMNGSPSALVRFDATPLDDDAILVSSLDRGRKWLQDRALAMTCIAQCGTCKGALGLTATYVSEREQFGAKLATFQAVAHRAADAWIDTQLVELTAWSALWQLSQDIDAREALAIAKVFCAEAGTRVVNAAQHLHGGIGMDLDYPVHRYFRWAKEHEQRFGASGAHLASLGHLLADETP